MVALRASRRRRTSPYAGLSQLVRPVLGELGENAAGSPLVPHELPAMLTERQLRGEDELPLPLVPLGIRSRVELAHLTSPIWPLSQTGRRPRGPAGGGGRHPSRG